MDLATWLHAWDGYALAAAITEQLSFPTALLHKHQVMQIACRESGQLAVIYDRLVRYVHLLRLSVR